MKIGHVHLKVRQLDRAVEFYTHILGFNVTERLGSHYAFLTGGEAHHELALQALGPGAVSPQSHAVGLYHSAFVVADTAEFAAAWDRLEKARLDIAPVDHGISWALYFSDLDGNGLEIYLDRRSSNHGQPAWHGASRELTRADLEAELESTPASVR